MTEWGDWQYHRPANECPECISNMEPEDWQLCFRNGIVYSGERFSLPQAHSFLWKVEERLSETDWEVIAYRTNIERKKP